MDKANESIEVLADVLRDFLKEPLAKAYAEAVVPKVDDVLSGLEGISKSQSSARNKVDEGVELLVEKIDSLIDELDGKNTQLKNTLEKCVQKNEVLFESQRGDISNLLSKHQEMMQGRIDLLREFVSSVETTSAYNQNQLRDAFNVFVEEDKRKSHASKSHFKKIGVAFFALLIFNSAAIIFLLISK